MSEKILAQPPIFITPHDLAPFIFLPQVVIVDTITLTSIFISWLIIDIANVGLVGWRFLVSLFKYCGNMCGLFQCLNTATVV